MKFASIRLITDDLDQMVAFYERVTGITAERPAPVFAEFITAAGSLAIGHVSTARAFGVGEVEAVPNRGLTIDWEVDDVDALDALHARLAAEGDEWALAPASMPWGNRSALLRDPDGNLVNFYAPETDAAKARFAGR